jgi:exonuclease SbcD
MRFIHTADWHLGRLMHGVHLTEDQAYVLDQFIDLIRDYTPDALLLSGDIYDRAVPPPDAVELLDDFLSRVVLGLGVPVLAIAGNHDSARRLEFGSRVLAGQGLHVFGTIDRGFSPVVLSDDAGPVHFYAVPFAEPSLVREKLAGQDIHDHNDAWHSIVDSISSFHPPGVRSVVLGHAFATGGTVSESERPLSIGGADRVDSSYFAGFNYAALGHLHRPQSAGSEHVRYAGSLLKYSFSEADHSKSIAVVEMGSKGDCTIETVSLTPRRDVRCVSGYLRDVLDGPESGENREDYLMVTLLDTGAILDAMGRLREVYPNALHVERPALDASSPACRPAMDHRKLNDADLFTAFFSQATGDEISPDQAAAYAAVVDAMRQQERETG